jgi:preprotein translocase subunit SecD
VSLKQEVDLEITTEDINDGSAVALASKKRTSRLKPQIMAEQRAKLKQAEEIEAQKALESASDLKTIDLLMARTARRGRRDDKSKRTRNSNDLRVRESKRDSNSGELADRHVTGQQENEDLQNNRNLDSAIDDQVQSITQKALAERRKIKLLEQISSAARTNNRWKTADSSNRGDPSSSNHGEVDKHDGTILHDLEDFDDVDESESTLGYLASKARNVW